LVAAWPERAEELADNILHTAKAGI